jgi:hypothetical protein
LIKKIYETEAILIKTAERIFNILAFLPLYRHDIAAKTTNGT